MKMMATFDKVITDVLAEKVKARLTFKVLILIMGAIFHIPGFKEHQQLYASMLIKRSLFRVCAASQSMLTDLGYL